MTRSVCCAAQVPLEFAKPGFDKVAQLGGERSAPVSEWRVIVAAAQ